MNRTLVCTGLIVTLLGLAGCSTRAPEPGEQPTKTGPSGKPAQADKLPDAERQLQLPETYTSFKPENCEFQARIAGLPEIREQFRGELLLTSASIRYSSGISLRVSCSPFLVVDRAAFKAQLESQIQFAARRAGVRNASVFIREQQEQTIASYWGIRGDRETGRFLRSDTYVGEHSFLEVLVMTPQPLKGMATWPAMIRVHKP